MVSFRDDDERREMRMGTVWRGVGGCVVMMGSGEHGCEDKTTTNLSQYEVPKTMYPKNNMTSFNLASAQYICEDLTMPHPAWTDR